MNLWAPVPHASWSCSSHVVAIVRGLNPSDGSQETAALDSRIRLGCIHLGPLRSRPWHTVLSLFWTWSWVWDGEGGEAIKGLLSNKLHLQFTQFDPSREIWDPMGTPSPSVHKPKDQRSWGIYTARCYMSLGSGASALLVGRQRGSGSQRKPAGRSSTGSANQNLVSLHRNIQGSGVKMGYWAWFWIQTAVLCDLGQIFNTSELSFFQ